jgi:hypothetical protein
MSAATWPVLLWCRSGSHDAAAKLDILRDLARYRPIFRRWV